MTALDLLVNQLRERKTVSEELVETVTAFIDSYLSAIEKKRQAEGRVLLEKWLELVLGSLNGTYTFEIYHQAIEHPFNYYQFGLDLIRPLVDFERSKLVGLDVVHTVENQLKNGENAIFFGNHQIEPDPQIISLMLESSHPDLAKKMIFVAGHRVTTDPLAIPMSLGRNLLCIFSKKHIQNPPEKKEEKVMHNQKTLKKMRELLTDGGVCIYVAPSGGRDRRQENGEVSMSRFDPDNLELFRLIAKQAKTPTHFYPLALKTHDLMPPPPFLKKDLGEKRIVHFTPVFVGFGPEFLFEDKHPPGIDKEGMRLVQASRLENCVKHLLSFA